MLTIWRLIRALRDVPLILGEFRGAEDEAGKSLGTHPEVCV